MICVFCKKETEYWVNHYGVITCLECSKFVLKILQGFVDKVFDKTIKPDMESKKLID
jgi:hypothetical protein